MNSHLAQRCAGLLLLLLCGLLGLPAPTSSAPPGASCEILDPLPAPAGEWRVTFDPERTEIRMTLGATLHTVRGTFRLERGEVTLDPETGLMSGEIAVDARSGDTGNRRRDRDMHEDVLLSESNRQVVLRPQRLEGDVEPEGRSHVEVHGEMVLLGEGHPVVLSLEVELADGELTAVGDLEIPYVEWGLTDPSTWLLRVANKVDISISAAGRLER